LGPDPISRRPFSSPAGEHHSQPRSHPNGSPGPAPPAPGAAPGGPPRRSGAPAEAVLGRLLARRVGACHALGVPVPARLRSGPPETLLLRLTGVDRRLTRELDKRGGVALGPWPGELPGEGDAPGDEDDDLDEQGEPAWVA
jgi:hypothetical protein